MIYVTHDQVEAMTMADQIVVLNEGRVEQIGAPLDLYHRPSSIFVAGFIGSPAMNFFDADTARPLKGLSVHPGASRIGIRPEHLTVTKASRGHMDVTVRVKESLGGESYLYTKTARGDDLVVKTDGDEPTEAGATVGLRISAERLHQFDAGGSALFTGGRRVVVPENA